MRHVLFIDYDFCDFVTFTLAGYVSSLPVNGTPCSRVSP